MKITLITVGKIKEKYFTDAISEYSKRLSRYCDLQILEVADEKTKENASEKEDELVRKKEGERILKCLKGNEYLVTLEIEGRSFTSESFARELSNLQVMGKSNIAFVIGGSLGLSKEVTSKSDMKISFSKMTFPHQLMRVIFLEQLYRAYRINNNEPYHK